MSEPENQRSDSKLTAAQEHLSQLWEEHVKHEFVTHNTGDTLATMVDDAYVNHIPVLTEGRGAGRVARVLFQAFHSSDASGYGNDSHFVNYWQQPTRG